MKKSSRNWTPEQDKMLEVTMTVNNGPRKLKWQQIAQLMHEKVQGCQKTGKQCRERWHNHLAPQLNNNSEWTQQQNNILFKKHSQLGNKWAKIATSLKGRTDNCVKNHFYSTLRRGMRKVNNFIHQQRKQKNSIKQFKPDVLTKILIVADGDPQQKLNAKNNAQTLSKKIKELLISISLETDENIYDQQKIDKVINFIMQFNKNCKKRKGKKKSVSIEKKINDDNQGDQNEFSQIQQASSASQSIKIEQIGMKQQKNNIIISQHIQKQASKEKFKKQIIKQEDVSNYQFPLNFEKTNLVDKLKNNTNEQFEDQNEQKDNVKDMQFKSSAISNQQWVNFQKQTKIIRAMSTQSEVGQFGGVNFGNNLFTSKINEPYQVFSLAGSGIDLFPNTNTDAETVSKQLLADSAVNTGFYKNQQKFLNNLSMHSEKNSMFNFEGQKGVVNADQFNGGQLKKSIINCSVQNCHKSQHFHERGAQTNKARLK